MHPAFAGTRVDQEIAAEVIAALRPVGTQVTFEVVERSLKQAKKKRNQHQGRSRSYPRPHSFKPQTIP